MVNFQNKKIHYTLREYQKNYNILLRDYLSQHEDFDEMMFIEIEIQFYNLCFENSNVVLGDFGEGPQYCINGGSCELLISEINEAISLNEGYDLELSTKYNTSFYKILKFLKDKKEKVSLTENNKYNPILNNCTSLDIKEIMINILHNNLSLFDSIKQIKTFTTVDTYDLFINEFNSVYNYLICEYMFSFDEHTILQAIEVYQHNLTFVYLNEADILKCKPFLRDIGKYKTVYNLFGFNSAEKENSIKFIHLNNLMIDYCNGFFHDPIQGYEHLISLKNVYEHLNKGNIFNEVGSNTNNIEDATSTITYIGDVFFEHKDILPISILNAFNKLGTFKYLYINEKNGEILNSYNLNPFERSQGKTLLEYYCLEENYLNLQSKIEDGTYIFFDNRPLDLYLYEYAKGFAKGYSDFEMNLTKKQTLIDEPQEQKALKVFSYVLNAKYKNGYFGDITENHAALKDKKGLYIDDDDFFKWGFDGGQFYKAWEIILNNPVVFEPLFQQYYKTSEPANILTFRVSENKSNNKIPAKFHALAYILELLADEKKPPQDIEGNFKKDEIIKIGKERCNDSGQSFYNYVKDHFNLVSSRNIKYLVYKNNWKETVLGITKYREELEKYIENNSL